MEVRFWGTRGSIPVPGPETVRYGGNTSCVELRSSTGDLFVIDCGTGARALGQSLLLERSGGRGVMLFGHTHWDHIHGLPFFAPLFTPGEHWSLYGPRGIGRSLEDTLAGQMEYTYFPVGLESLGATVDYHDLVEGTFSVFGATIRTQYLNHPALTLAYRIELDGRCVVYASDHEPFDPALGAGGDVQGNSSDARHVEFLRGADLVIHDAQYYAAEYAHKIGWGHSTMEYVVDVACAAAVDTLVLHHHDASRDDAGVDALVAAAAQRAKAAQNGLVVIGAREGETIGLAPRARPQAAVSPRRATAPAAVNLAGFAAVVLHDDTARVTARSALEAENLRVVTSDDVSAADAATGSVVIIADVDDGGDDLQEVLARYRHHSTVVLGLTTNWPAPDEPSVTQWAVWPSTPAHLRTKVRAAILGRYSRWLAAPRPKNEAARLSALRELHLLDTPPEPRFDTIAQAAAQALAMPVALVTLVDAHRQWFKARCGIDLPETPRDQSVCAHAILGKGPFVVEDLLVDERFADSPAAHGNDRLRFYAGIPLRVKGGVAVGTLCVADHRPRTLDDEQLRALREFARRAEQELRR